MIYKRKLNKKTNYRKRLGYLLSRKPRLVIRKSNSVIYSQIIEYSPNGDKTIVSVSSKHLIKFGYNGSIKSTPSAYLTGLLIAKKAKEKSIKEAVPDIGFHSNTKGSIIFALIKGAKDGGLSVSIDDSILPSEQRLIGNHIVAFTKKQKLSSSNIDLSKNFEEVKGSLLGK